MWRLGLLAWRAIDVVATSLNSIGHKLTFRCLIRPP
jgi:hypothetical protein